MTRGKRVEKFEALTAGQRALAEEGLPIALRLAAKVAARTGMDADDLAGEACLFVCRLAQWFDGSRGKPFAALAYRFTRGHLWHLARLRLRRPRLTGLTEADPASLDPEPGEGFEAILALAGGLLTGRMREALRLRHLEGLSAAEAAARMGIGRLGVNDLTQRACRKLRSEPEFARKVMGEGR